MVFWPTESCAWRPASICRRYFHAVYLLGHGAVKLAVIAGLAWRIRAAYPVAIAVFAGFIAYQMLRWTHTHSPMMILLSLVDGVVIWLTWREWRLAASSAR